MYLPFRPNLIQLSNVDTPKQGVNCILQERRAIMEISRGFIAAALVLKNLKRIGTVIHKHITPPKACLKIFLPSNRACSYKLFNFGSTGFITCI